MSDDERDEKELDLTSPDVVTKYKSAAEIVNKALQLVISECKPNVKIVDICEKGDSFIREQTGKLYKNVKKKIERGLAFPTCISVNNTVCHFSPLASDETVLEVGDILKIDLACHIDGFIAAVAHTHVLQEGPITGRAADVIAAANTAAEVALRLVRPGKKMSGIGRPKGRPRGSGGKGNGKVPTIPTSLEQRSTTKYTTPRVVTPSPSSSNHGAPLGTVPIPSIPSSSEQMNTSKNTTPNDSTQSPSSSNPSVHLSTSHVPSPITERTPTPLTEEDNDHNSQPENFIPFGDPTLPGPHNPHLPWGKDLTDNKIWIYTLKGYFYPDDKVTKDISKAIKSMFDGPYNNWKCCNDKIKKMWFNEWMKNYKWIGEQEATIKATWESKAKDLLRKIMARVREKVSEKPKWITHVVWAQLLAMWEDDHYMTNRCVAASNRDSDVGGSLHTQGSKNQLKHELELVQCSVPSLMDLDEDDNSADNATLGSNATVGADVEE